MSGAFKNLLVSWIFAIVIQFALMNLANYKYEVVISILQSVIVFVILVLQQEMNSKKYRIDDIN